MTLPTRALGGSGLEITGDRIGLVGLKLLILLRSFQFTPNTQADLLTDPNGAKIRRIWDGLSDRFTFSVVI